MINKYFTVFLLVFIPLINARPLYNGDIRREVSAYCDSPGTYSSIYGNIENWDVSEVTFMHAVFTNKSTCNPNISSWNVGKVTDFNAMFHNAHLFNQNISGWDVSKGTRFGYMFNNARSFNQNVSGWNMSKATDTLSMFYQAYAFHQDLSSWPQAETSKAWFCTDAVCNAAPNTDGPTNSPTNGPSDNPTNSPTNGPSDNPTNGPTNGPSYNPTNSPSSKPTNTPTEKPTSSPTNAPTKGPTKSPTYPPTNDPCDSVEEHLSTKFARIPNRGKTGDCKWLKEQSNELRASVCGHRTWYWKDPRTGTVYPPAQEACPITCNACGRCFENEKTRYTKYVYKDEFIIGLCKFLGGSSRKDAICNRSLTGNMYPTANEACPQTCGLPGCKK